MEPNISSFRPVIEESAQWPANTFEQQLHQQKIIDEQKRKIELLIRENELLKRQMQMQVATEKTPEDVVNTQVRYGPRVANIATDKSRSHQIDIRHSAEPEGNCKDH